MIPIPSAAEFEQRLQQMAAEIQLQIPGAEVRLFGSRARGEATPDSDIELLISASEERGSARSALKSNLGSTSPGLRAVITDPWPPPVSASSSMQATNDQCTDLQCTDLLSKDLQSTELLSAELSSLELSSADQAANDLPPGVAITVLVAVFVVVPLIYGLGLGHQYPGTCSPMEALGHWWS
jgi:hypothetical protein